MSYFIANLQAIRRGSTIRAIIVVRPFSWASVTKLVSSIGRSIKIFRGFKGKSDYFMILTLETVRYDLGSHNASITLGCWNEEVNVYVQTRTARSVQNIRRNSQKWAITCAVDTYLKPGDTFIIGNGYSFVVASIEYQISPYQATMIVREN